MWAMMLSITGPCTPKPPAAPPSDVVVQLFEWPFADVGRECEAVLGPTGVGMVQVSPPQEHILLDTAPWWERYQPVTSTLDGRLGNRADFRRMVRRCAQAGVGVMVDVVLNHTTGVTDGVGSAGTPARRYDIPGWYDDASFHRCRKPIRNWRSRRDIFDCELFGLPDLATETEPVRARLAAHLNDLGRLGAQGLRIDSAKHIPPADLAAILSRVPHRFETVLEVIDHGNEVVRADEYVALGRVTDFRYGHVLSAAVRRGDLASLRHLGQGLLPSHASLAFVDNHDTQRQPVPERPLTHVDGPRHEMAVAYLLAWPYGRPRVMSSYTFDDRDAGAPLGPDGRSAPALDARGACRSPFVCEHRSSTTRGMIGFRRAVRDAPVEHWSTAGRARVAFSRGSRGFVAFNANPEEPWAAELPTSLLPGRYCDVASRRSTGGSCTHVVEVDDRGRVAVDLGPYDVLAIHRGALAP